MKTNEEKAEMQGYQQSEKIIEWSENCTKYLTNIHGANLTRNERYSVLFDAIALQGHIYIEVLQRFEIVFEKLQKCDYTSIERKTNISKKGSLTWEYNT